MKKFVLLAAAAVACLATPAMATKGNNGGGNGGCGNGQQTNGCGTPTPTPTPTPTSSPIHNTNAQAQGQLQGQLQGQAQGQIATGGNATGGNATGGIGLGGAGGSVLASGNSANDIRNTNTANGGNVLASGNSSNDIRNSNTNDVRNTNTNITGPSTSTSGAISGSLSNSVNDNSNSADNSSRNTANVDVNVEGDTYVNKQRRIPVSTAYAPALTSGIDTCLGSMSGGAQTGVFGISFGGTKSDKTCEAIKLGREAAAMGMPDVQCQILAQDDRFARALSASNRSCALPSTAVSAAPSAADRNPAVRYENRAVVQPIPVNPIYTK